MVPEGFIDKLKKLSDEDLLDILNAVSDEVKYRTLPKVNNLNHDNIKNMLKIVAEAVIKNS